MPPAISATHGPPQGGAKRRLPLWDRIVAEVEKKIVEAFEVFHRGVDSQFDPEEMFLTCFQSEWELLAFHLGRPKTDSYSFLCAWCATFGALLLEIGSIIRSLGCFPTEAEVQEVLAKVEEEPPTGYFHLEKFLPVMMKVILDRRYPPVPEDVLLHAFEALDQNKCGYITKEDLEKYLTEEGEPFTQEEMEDMVSAALDPETNTVHYRDYIEKLVID
ncbi:dynein regulatory complex protein 8 [Phaenicophaeus curvirostris]|uniref:dynein regulatory complex protein 8 n=1 Tax=Phaenicophaeus curvirostris TaxID=33595 RepID=UPI0037F0E52B